MTRKIISTPKAPAAIGPYSQATVLNGMVFTAGQIPLDPETGEIVEGILNLDETRHAAQLLLSNDNKHSGHKHPTTLLVEISRNGHALPEGTKDQLKQIGFNFSGKLVNRTLSVRPEAAGRDLYYDSGFFRFHYTLNNSFAVDETDSDMNDIPDYVDQMAEIFNEVYTIIVNDMGFNQPPTDGWYEAGYDNGGTDHFDVYIGNPGPGYYGLTQAEYFANGSGDNENTAITEQNAANCYMAMRNDYSGFPNTEIENIMVTAAHEFFHVIQFGYDVYEMIWLMESSAVWIEDEVYDDINDCYQYMTSWFNQPEESVDNPAYPHCYGSFIYFQYIDEHLGGAESIKKIWESSIRHNSEHDDYSHVAIDEGLAPVHSSFRDALLKMVVANRIMSSSSEAGIYSYEEAEDYPVALTGPSTAEVVNYYQNMPLSETSTALNLFGSEYYRLVTDVPVNVEIVNLSTPDSDDLILESIIRTSNGQYLINSGRTLNIDPALGFSSIYIAVISQDNQGNNWDYRLDFSDGESLEMDISNIYPNPFIRNAESQLYPTLEITANYDEDINITVYDLMGQKLKVIYDGELTPDIYQFQWNGNDRFGNQAPSGIYLFRIDGERTSVKRKLILLK